MNDKKIVCIDLVDFMKMEHVEKPGMFFAYINRPGDICLKKYTNELTYRPYRDNEFPIFISKFKADGSRDAMKKIKELLKGII